MTKLVGELSRHKRGNEERHYDDACAADDRLGRFAVADGASDSGFAGLWARLLVEQFVRLATCEADQWSAWLPDVQKRWREELEGRDLPYYGEEQFRQGSFATFLGVVVSRAVAETGRATENASSTSPAPTPKPSASKDAGSAAPPTSSFDLSAENFDQVVVEFLNGSKIDDDDDDEIIGLSQLAGSLRHDSNPDKPTETRPTWAWHAVAVGDSCLFQTRNGRLIKSFPIADAAEFDNNPWLVGSRTTVDEIRDKRAVVVQGEAKAGDRLWLMSDALAQWFLVESQAGRTPWTELAAFVGPPSSNGFAEWLDRMRNERRMRNDDVTLLAVEFGLDSCDSPP